MFKNLTNACLAALGRGPLMTEAESNLANHEVDQPGATTSAALPSAWHDTAAAPDETEAAPPLPEATPPAAASATPSAANPTASPPTGPAAEFGPDTRKLRLDLERLRNDQTRRTRKEQREHVEKIKRLGQFICDTENGPKAPTDASEKAHLIERARITEGETRRAELIAKCDAWLARKVAEWGLPYPTGADATSPPKLRLACDPDVQANLSCATGFYVFARKFAALHFDLTSPESHLAELQHALISTTDLAKMREIKAQIAAIAATDSPQAKFRAKGEVDKKWAYVREDLAKMLAVAEQKLRDWHAEVEVQEILFHESMGVAHEPGPASRRYTEELKRLKQVSPTYEGVLHYLGIKDPLDL